MSHKIIVVPHYLDRIGQTRYFTELDVLRSQYVVLSWVSWAARWITLFGRLCRESRATSGN